MPVINRSLFYRFCASLTFAVMVTGATGLAQDTAPKSSTVLSAEGYSKLLDVIFQKEQIVSLKIAYTLVLRFRPNEGPESQLLFRVWSDRRVEAQLYMVQNESAWMAADKFKAQTGKEDIEAIARLIPVERHRLTISFAEIEKWHSLLFDALRGSDSALQQAAAEYRKNGTTETVLDGTRYDLWFVQGESECHWSFSDIDLNDAATRANLPVNSMDEHGPCGLGKQTLSICNVYRQRTWRRSLGRVFAPQFHPAGHWGYLVRLGLLVGRRERLKW